MAGIFTASLITPYFGMAAAAFGFVGSVVILMATWSTIGLRKTIVEAGELKSRDRTIANGIVILKTELSKQQIEELGREHRLYLLGATLLAISFVLSFVHELIQPSH